MCVLLDSRSVCACFLIQGPYVRASRFKVNLRASRFKVNMCVLLDSRSIRISLIAPIAKPVDILKSNINLCGIVPVIRRVCLVLVHLPFCRA